MTLQIQNNAICLLKKFIEEKLSGNIDNLPKFDFRNLENSDLFGCPNRTFDCDNSNLANAIYIILWSSALPDCTPDTIGTGKAYRGDTMNTFHTMFGREDQNNPGFFVGLERYLPDNKMRERARNFHILCTNIGNFTLLPNLAEENQTLNLYRGTNAWKDFFDCFLIHLERCLTDKPDKDEFLARLILKNDFFFHRFKNENGITNLAKLFFLEDFLDENEKPRKLFILNYHWKKPSDRENYLKAADTYLNHTVKIINHRAEKITAKLKEILHAADTV